VSQILLFFIVYLRNPATVFPAQLSSDLSRSSVGLH
jgi:hypothetical protein